MKICPQCQSTYTNDDLQFCLQDGAPLNTVNTGSQDPTAVWNSEPETVIKADRNQMRINLQQPETQQNQAIPTNPQTQFHDNPPPKKSKAWIFLLLGLIVLLFVGGAAAIAAYFLLKPQTTVVQGNTNNSNNGTNTNSTDNANANANANANVTPTPKPTLKPAEIDAAKKEAESALYGWKAAAESHNLDTNLSSYADTVDYYKGGKINKTKLRASKEPAYKKYDQIKIDIDNMKVVVDPTGEKATVTFDKTWDFAGVDKDGNDVVNRGSVQQQVILTKVNGKWKISSEKDMKVYYVDKGEDGDY
ncbi:MAG: hypothetical protein K1X72_01255 [Pyrinomonadaceae bacterium]|nr:hypothetical protein [Pyrinomonadaceae bacterium]